MCGLAGVISSHINGSEEGIFRDLFNVSSLRGFQGSGVMVYQKPSNLWKGTGNVRTIRSRYVSGALAYSDELDELLKPSCSIIAGHARWPTKGGTEDSAIHPHRHGHIIGEHNGTLWQVAGQSVKDNESDSSLLFQAISEVGIKEAIKETRGAYALVWIDEKEETLNFLRNSQRTLFFKNVGYNKNIQTLYWASEAPMLDFIFQRTYRGTNTWDTYLPTDVLIKYPLKPNHRILPVEVVREVAPVPFAVETRRPYGPQGGSAGTVRDRWQGRLADADLQFDPQTNRMRPARHGRFLDGPDGENVIPLLPPPSTGSTLTKTQQKKIMKRQLAEERKEQKKRERLAIQEAAAKARGTFQCDDVGDCEPVDTTTEAEVEANTPTPSWSHNHGGGRMNEGNLNQVRRAVDDLFPPHDVDENEDNDVPFTRTHGGISYARGYYGRGCAWCGTVATSGDRVVPVGSDLGGSNEFVCLDCSTYDGCREWLADKSPVIVTMD